MRNNLPPSLPPSPTMPPPAWTSTLPALMATLPAPMSSVPALVTTSARAPNWSSEPGLTGMLLFTMQGFALGAQMSAAVVAAALLGLFASSQWLTVLTWWHQQPFASSDPLLGRNAAFYVFTLPLLELARGIALALVVLAAVGSAALYAFAGELALTPFGVRMGQPVRRHGALLAACAFLVFALGAWLDALPAPAPSVPADAEAVARGEFERGIVLGGSGNGEAIVANRIADSPGHVDMARSGQ